MLTITPQRSRLSDGCYIHNLLIYDDHGLRNLKFHQSITLHCINKTALIKLKRTLEKLTTDF